MSGAAREILDASPLWAQRWTGKAIDWYCGQERSGFLVISSHHSDNTNPRCWKRSLQRRRSAMTLKSVLQSSSMTAVFSEHGPKPSLGSIPIAPGATSRPVAGGNSSMMRAVSSTAASPSGQRRWDGDRTTYLAAMGAGPSTASIGKACAGSLPAGNWWNSPEKLRRSKHHRVRGRSTDADRTSQAVY